MKSTLYAILLLGALASTAAAHRGYDALQKTWAAFENAGNDFQALLDAYADDAVLEFRGGEFGHKYEGVNQRGKDGFSIEAYMTYLGEFNFLEQIKHVDSATLDDESHAVSVFDVYSQHKTTGERLKTSWLTEYTFNEKGQLQRIYQVNLSAEKIDAASIYTKAVAGYNVGKAEYWLSKIVDETVMVIHGGGFAEYKDLEGTYKGKGEFFKYMTKANELFDHQIAVDGGFLVGGNVLTSSADGKTVYAEQAVGQVRKSDGAKFFMNSKHVITFNDFGNVVLCESRVTDIDYYTSGAHSEL